MFWCWNSFEEELLLHCGSTQPCPSDQAREACAHQLGNSSAWTEPILHPLTFHWLQQVTCPPPMQWSLGRVVPGREAACQKHLCAPEDIWEPLVSMDHPRHSRQVGKWQTLEVRLRKTIDTLWRESGRCERMCFFWNKGEIKWVDQKSGL